MKTFVGILTAAVLGTAACGAARAGDRCDYPRYGRDGRSSYDRGADGDAYRGDASRGDASRGDAYGGDYGRGQPSRGDASRGDAYGGDYGRGDAQRPDHAGPRARLLQGDCGDFTYRDWLPRRQAYVFWSPRDKGWYYWCSASDGYLPYDQFEAHPPKSDTVPEMPKGLPPLAPGGVDREAAPPGQDLMPPALPDDAPAVPDARRFSPIGAKGAPAR